MSQTASQFAWACADAGDYPPPEPKKKGAPRYGSDNACWLCGAPTYGVGWPRKIALNTTFCDHNSAKRIDSDTVCQACVATSQSAGWLQYCQAHPDRGLWTHFPDKGNGDPRSFNWLYASHVFTPGHHETPDRKRWREILADPPEPPFLMILAVSGKKQVLFRGRVSQSRESFWVQADATRILVRPERFTACLSAFEALYHAGFSKDSIVSGDYHSGQLAKTGLATWKSLEDAIRPWRESEPGLMQLCHHCAQKPVNPDAPPPEPKPQRMIAMPKPPPAPDPQPSQPQQQQLELF